MALSMKPGRGRIPDYGLPILSSAQVEQADSAALYEPGIVIVVRNKTSGLLSLAKYIELDNAGCSQGEALVNGYATLGIDVVAKASTTDGRQPVLRGIAAATIASQKYGWMYISGYVEKADISHTAASGELLCISGSTAGKLTPDGASSVLNSTIGTVSQVTIPFAVAVARGAFATGVGSVSIIGCWG